MIDSNDIEKMDMIKILNGDDKIAHTRSFFCQLIFGDSDFDNFFIERTAGTISNL